MIHYADIQNWSDAKLFDITGAVFEDGFETEQEGPEESRSQWTRDYLVALHEKHDECIKETNRRTTSLRAKKEREPMT